MRQLILGSMAVSLLLLPGGPLQSEEKTAAAKPSVKVTGVLLLANGTPVKGKEVVAYPLDASGKAIGMQRLGKGGQVELWNPTAVTDGSGRFVLIVPSVKRIGKTEMSEFGLSTAKPPGGIVTVTVWSVVLTDGSEEMALVHGAASMPMLADANGVVRVKFVETSKDVGSITMD